MKNKTHTKSQAKNTPLVDSKTRDEGTATSAPTTTLARVQDAHTPAETFDNGGHYKLPKCLDGNTLTGDVVMTRLTQYFESCRERGISTTFTGLCSALDVSEQTLRALLRMAERVEYEDDDDPAAPPPGSDYRKALRAIKRAHLVVTSRYEQILTAPKSRPVGAIFALKAWADWSEGMDPDLKVAEDLQRAPTVQIILSQEPPNNPQTPKLVQGQATTPNQGVVIDVEPTIDKAITGR